MSRRRSSSSYPNKSTSASSSSGAESSNSELSNISDSEDRTQPHTPLLDRTESLGGNTNHDEPVFVLGSPKSIVSLEAYHQLLELDQSEEEKAIRANRMAMEHAYQELLAKCVEHGFKEVKTKSQSDPLGGDYDDQALMSLDFFTENEGLEIRGLYEFNKRLKTLADSLKNDRFQLSEDEKAVVDKIVERSTDAYSNIKSSLVNLQEDLQEKKASLDLSLKTSSKVVGMPETQQRWIDAKARRKIHNSTSGTVLQDISLPERIKMKQEVAEAVTNYEKKRIQYKSAEERAKNNGMGLLIAPKLPEVNDITQGIVKELHVTAQFAAAKYFRLDASMVKDIRIIYHHGALYAVNPSPRIMTGADESNFHKNANNYDNSEVIKIELDGIEDIINLVRDFEKSVSGGSSVKKLSAMEKLTKFFSGNDRKDADDKQTDQKNNRDDEVIRFLEQSSDYHLSGNDLITFTQKPVRVSEPGEKTGSDSISNEEEIVRPESTERLKSLLEQEAESGLTPNEEKEKILRESESNLKSLSEKKTELTVYEFITKGRLENNLEKLNNLLKQEEELTSDEEKEKIQLEMTLNEINKNLKRKEQETVRPESTERLKSLLEKEAESGLTPNEEKEKIRLESLMKRNELERKINRLKNTYTNEVAKIVDILSRQPSASIEKIRTVLDSLSKDTNKDEHMRAISKMLLSKIEGIESTKNKSDQSGLTKRQKIEASNLIEMFKEEFDQKIIDEIKTIAEQQKIYSEGMEPLLNQRQELNKQLEKDIDAVEKKLAKTLKKKYNELESKASQWVNKTTEALQSGQVQVSTVNFDNIPDDVSILSSETEGLLVENDSIVYQTPSKVRVEQELTRMLSIAYDLKESDEPGLGQGALAKIVEGEKKVKLEDQRVEREAYFENGGLKRELSEESHTEERSLEVEKQDLRRFALDNHRKWMKKNAKSLGGSKLNAIDWVIKYQEGVQENQKGQKISPRKVNSFLKSVITQENVESLRDFASLGKQNGDYISDLEKLEDDRYQQNKIVVKLNESSFGEKDEEVILTKLQRLANVLVQTEDVLSQTEQESFSSTNKGIKRSKDDFLDTYVSPDKDYGKKRATDILNDNKVESLKELIKDQQLEKADVESHEKFMRESAKEAAEKVAKYKDCISLVARLEVMNPYLKTVGGELALRDEYTDTLDCLFKAMDNLGGRSNSLQDLNMGFMLDSSFSTGSFSSQEDDSRSSGSDYTEEDVIEKAESAFQVFNGIKQVLLEKIYQEKDSDVKLGLFKGQNPPLGSNEEAESEDLSGFDIPMGEEIDQSLPTFFNDDGEISVISNDSGSMQSETLNSIPRDAISQLLDSSDASRPLASDYIKEEEARENIQLCIKQSIDRMCEMGFVFFDDEYRPTEVLRKLVAKVYQEGITDDKGQILINEDDWKKFDEITKNKKISFGHLTDIEQRDNAIIDAKMGEWNFFWKIYRKIVNFIAVVLRDWLPVKYDLKTYDWNKTIVIEAKDINQLLKAQLGLNEAILAGKQKIRDQHSDKRDKLSQELKAAQEALAALNINNIEDLNDTDREKLEKEKKALDDRVRLLKVRLGDNSSEEFLAFRIIDLKFLCEKVQNIEDMTAQLEHVKNLPEDIYDGMVIDPAITNACCNFNQSARSFQTTLTKTEIQDHQLSTKAKTGEALPGQVYRLYKDNQKTNQILEQAGKSIASLNELKDRAEKGVGEQTERLKNAIDVLNEQIHRLSDGATVTKATSALAEGDLSNEDSNSKETIKVSYDEDIQKAVEALRQQKAIFEKQLNQTKGLKKEDFKEFEKQIEDYDKLIKLVKKQIFSTLASSKGVIERLEIIQDDTDLGAQKAKEELISMFGLDKQTHLFDNKQNISLDDSQFKQSFINEMFVKHHDMTGLEKTFRKMDVEARVARRELYRIVNKKFKEVRERIKANDNNAEIEKSLYVKLDHIGNETRPCLIMPNPGSEKEPRLDVTPDEGSKKEPRLDVTPGNAKDILDAMSSAVREEEVPLLSQDEIDRINTLILGGRKKGEDVDTRQPKAVELKTAELIRKLDDSRRSGVSSSQGSGSSSDITYHSDASLDSYQSAHSRSQESDSGASVYTARSRESDGSHRERAGSSSSQKTKDSHNKGEAHGKNPR